MILLAVLVLFLDGGLTLVEKSKKVKEYLRGAGEQAALMLYVHVECVHARKQYHGIVVHTGLTGPT